MKGFVGSAGDLLASSGDLLTSSVLLAATGLICAALALVLPWVRSRKPPRLHSIFIAFLSGYILPTGLALLLYPFLSPKPTLEEIYDYLPLAGIGILWACIVTIRNELTLGPGSSTGALDDSRMSSGKQVDGELGTGNEGGPEK